MTNKQLGFCGVVVTMCVFALAGKPIMGICAGFLVGLSALALFS